MQHYLKQSLEYCQVCINLRTRVQGGRKGWCVRWHFFSLVDRNIIANKSRDTYENDDLPAWKEFIGSWFSLMCQIILVELLFSFPV